jgi:hypothetical protein
VYGHPDLWPRCQQRDRLARIADAIVAGAVIVIFVVLCVALLGGCATFTAPENERRVTEYGASGGAGVLVPADAQGRIGGCRLVVAGAADGCMRYTGESCEYASPDCSDSSGPAPDDQTGQRTETPAAGLLDQLQQLLEGGSDAEIDSEAP